MHCLSETIGGLFDVPHGLCNAMLLAPVLRNVRIETDRMPKNPTAAIDGIELAPIGLGAIRELWLRFDLP